MPSKKSTDCTVNSGGHRNFVLFNVLGFYQIISFMIPFLFDFFLFCFFNLMLSVSSPW